VDIPLLLRADARYLLLEAGDKHPAAQQQGIAFALAAFEGYAVHEALEVQRDFVAHGGPVLLLLHQMLRQETLDGLVGVVVGELDILPRGGQALVLTQLHLRVQVDEGGEGVAVWADGLHVQGGRGGDLDVLGGDGLHQCGGEGLVHRLLIEQIVAVCLFQRLTGSLAHGVALHRVQGLDLLIGVVQGLLPRITLHGDGQAQLAVGQLLFLLQDHGDSSISFHL